MMKPEDLLRADILGLNAYHVPPARGMVKLDAMENPYPLPDALQRRVGEVAAEVALNRYPDPSGAALKTVLRESQHVPEGAAILLGNGSDEIIQILAMGLARPGAVMLGVEPSFVMYRMIATFTGMRYVGVPLNADFTLDLPATLAAIEREQPALVFIAYPNNPTGNLHPAHAIEAILDAAPGVVVVDEAYHAFAAASFMSELPRRPNLLVMRTLSKIGLAATRLGFVAGAPAWLDSFEKLRLPYNINSLTQAVAVEVLRAQDVLHQQAQALIAERATLAARLMALPGVEVFPSRANFILFRVPDAPAVFERLKSHKILIKNLNGAHPLLTGCLRVTVGAPLENQAFLTALGQSLAA